jgi:hypothetical protein
MCTKGSLEGKGRKNVALAEILTFKTTPLEANKRGYREVKLN